MSAPNDDYQPADAGSERGTGADTTQDDYVNRPGQEGGVPVVSDNNSADAGGYADSGTADSDAQLQADDRDAIDSSNIIDSKTRGAGPEGGYKEPGDTEGLPENDGTSAVAGGPN